jgi:hypothetical protein
MTPEEKDPYEKQYIAWKEDRKKITPSKYASQFLKGSTLRRTLVFSFF